MSPEHDRIGHFSGQLVYPPYAARTSSFLLELAKELHAITDPGWSVKDVDAAGGQLLFGQNADSALFRSERADSRKDARSARYVHASDERRILEHPKAIGGCESKGEERPLKCFSFVLLNDEADHDLSLAWVFNA